ncbi:glucuronate isomerase [Caproiciproducens sp. NJN-50]|uniref:glucuronate isomerase n=1 Tax=Caproiciproducens sp. NJN-50 TaxID=2507162 RepID=UPI000FFDFA37|nr:glucuronate isomerase [Caproiciproducens sp. NJN-50]QAT48765.1 glucuronate isomerase [Caproiciproducens sp. NJN-50]
MKPFLDEDFLLLTDTAKRLYHEAAEGLPIIDYHCHISPKEIFENRRFDNIAQVWLGGDHYKWRLIRACGIDEKYITGTRSSDREKFQKFAEALPLAIGNPMIHWTQLELKRYFGCSLFLSGETAEEIWNLCNRKLKEDSLSVRGIIRTSNVEVIATTDDPADDLSWHQKISGDASCAFKVVPSFRPDKAIRVEKPEFAAYIRTLSQAHGIEIRTLADLFAALEKSIAFFDSMGCRASDHALEYVFCRNEGAEKADAVFQKALAGGELTVEEIEAYKTALLLFLGKQYVKYDWAMQIHYNALRNNRTSLYGLLGPDTGNDCMGSYACAEGLIRLLDAMDSQSALPKMILYSLSPNDNAMIDSVIGSFQGPGVRGRLQHGGAWWFNDSKGGMESQMTSLANLSVLGNFVGMVTDSRSFLSYTRHEYFRRILCNLLGTWVENGEYPCDFSYLTKIIRGICYENAKEYFRYDRA